MQKGFVLLAAAALMLACSAPARGQVQVQPQPAPPQPTQAPPQTKGLELMPENVFTLLTKGYDLFRDGKYKAADAKFKEALKLDPHNPFAYNNLAALLERQGQPKEAMACLYLAIYYVARYPDNGEQRVFPGGITAAVKPLREFDVDHKIAKMIAGNRGKLYQKIVAADPQAFKPPPPPAAPQH